MKFRRVKKNSVFFGVCTGIQDLLKQKGYDADVYVIRFIIVLLIVLVPVVDALMIAGYLIAGLVFPTKEEEENEENKIDLTKKDDENNPS